MPKKTTDSNGSTTVSSTETSSFLSHVPGTTPWAKAASVKKILDGIGNPGDSLQQKMQVVQTLVKLLNDGSQVDPCDPKSNVNQSPADSTEEITQLRQIYPLLEGLAGSDGVLNHRDSFAIAEALLKSGRNSDLADLLTSKASGIGGLLGNKAAEPTIRSGLQLLGSFADTFVQKAPQVAQKPVSEAIDGMLNELGVAPQAVGITDPDGPLHRNLPVGQLLALLRSNPSSTASANKGGSSWRQDLQQIANIAHIIGEKKIRFPDGIPIQKLKPLITDGTIPFLKIRLSEDGAIEIR